MHNSAISLEEDSQPVRGEISEVSMIELNSKEKYYLIKKLAR